METRNGCFAAIAVPGGVPGRRGRLLPARGRVSARCVPAGPLSFTETARKKRV